MQNDYQTVFDAASTLSVADRLRLIDDLASQVPDDQPPTLSDEWIAEIDRREEEVKAGTVDLEDWQTIRERVATKHGLGDAN